MRWLTCHNVRKRRSQNTDQKVGGSNPSERAHLSSLVTDDFGCSDSV